MSPTVRDNKTSNRYELDADGHIAFAAYRRDGNVITITHTEVPKKLSGKGIGSQLVVGALALVRGEGARVRPLCPFVKSYIDKHPEYADLLA